jgi:hypothetical protein
VEGMFSADVDIWASPLEILITTDGASKKLIAKDAVVSLPAAVNSIDPDDSTGVSFNLQRFPFHPINLHLDHWIMRIISILLCLNQE